MSTMQAKYVDKHGGTGREERGWMQSMEKMERMVSGLEWEGGNGLHACI